MVRNMRVVVKRVRALFRRVRQQAELDAEIRDHLESLAADHVRRGLSPADARAAARREFGGVEQIKEAYRAQRGLPVVDWLLQSVRYAARSLRRSPGFTFATIALLALGIGVNTAIFSLVDAVLLRELPYREPDRLVWLWSVRPENEGPFNTANFLDYRDRNRTLESIGAFAEVNTILTGAGDPVRLRGVRVTANLFQILGTSALLGRPLEPRDDRPDAPPVVVVTEAMWRERLGGDRDIIGRKLVLSGAPYAVVGVLPSTFVFPRATPDYATPMAADRDPARTNHGAINLLRVIGRLGPGVNAGQAQADLTNIARQLRVEYPQGNSLKIAVRVESLRDAVLGSARDSLEIVVAAVSLLLLVVIVNVASSLLARATARRKELAVRAALGANRVQLLAQPIAENVLLAVAGGVLGVPIARWIFPALQAWNPLTFPRAELAVVGGTAVWYAAALSLVVVLLIAIAPTWQIPVHVVDTLRARGAASRLSRRTRSVLVISEVALSFALLLGASAMSQTLVRLLRVQPGFESRQLLTAALTLPRGRYDDAQSVQAFLDRVRARLRSERSVQSWSAVSIFPLSGATGGAPFQVKGAEVALDRRPLTNYRFIEPDYFQTMQIPMRAGRDFSVSDSGTARGVVIVNEQFVRRFLGGRDPIGTHLIVKDDDKVGRDVEIVGVVGNVRQVDLDEPP
ncbi:MAG TPA: ABC transporter permease, partial [Gemmatimonadaceae bacterium]|nr:ABC transporter permease [Gemmatimonadaceae bacterium]